MSAAPSPMPTPASSASTGSTAPVDFTAPPAPSATAGARPGGEALLRDAVEALRAGRPVLVSDDPDREDEADLIMPALGASAAWVGFMIRHTSGMLCVPMSAQRAAALGLPPMVADNQDPKGTAYTVSCDAVGVGTGIGAADRALTVNTLADPAAGPERLSRPGHVFPLVAHPDGLAGRRGHTEAAVALMDRSGLAPVGVIGELVGDDGEPLRGDAVVDFAREHRLVHLDLDDIGCGPLETADGAPSDAQPADPAATAVEPGLWGSSVNLPGRFGPLRARVRRGATGDIVWITGERGLGHEPSVRLHSACLTGDVLGSHRCDCGEQLAQSLRRLVSEGGVVLYLCGHEGRGIGLAAKLEAYALQEQGMDTVEANLALGRGVDERDYEEAAAALRERGVTRLRLTSNNPAKEAALRAAGLTVVATEPTGYFEHPENRGYLRTKEERMGHRFASGRQSA